MRKASLFHILAAEAILLAACANPGDSSGPVLQDFHRIPNPDFLDKLGTTFGNEATYGLSLALDEWGGVYVGGLVNAAPTLPYDAEDPSTFQHGMVARFDLEGHPVWARHFYPQPDPAGNTALTVEGVAVDKEGTRVFVAGMTMGALNDQANANTGMWSSNDAYVTALDATTGEILWTRQFGSRGCDWLEAVALGADGEVVVGGYNAAEGAGWPAYDLMLARLDPATGELLWQKSWGGAGYDQLSDLAISRWGAIFLTGTTGGGFEGLASSAHETAFLGQVDLDGGLVFLRALPPEDPDYSSYGDRIAIDDGPSAGRETAFVGWGDIDAHLSRFASNGTPDWTLDIASSYIGPDGSAVDFSALPGWGAGFPEDRVYDVLVDAFGNVYLGGLTFGSLDGTPFSDPWDPSWTITNEAWPDGYDAWFARVDGAKGTLTWLRQFHSPRTEVMGLCLDNNQDLWVMGNTWSDLGGIPPKTDEDGTIWFNIYLARWAFQP